ncbi:hypothetical protein BH24GEM3_BH24GEM3_14910 [soil metagenome]
MTTRNLRELVLAQRQRGDLDAAAKTLQEAIAQNRDDAELADLYGMLGGTRREQGDLVAAVAAYDEGFRLEAKLDSTYNALNRLVTRIALEPASLSDAEALRNYDTLEPVDVPGSLAELQPRLRADVEGARAGDFWAAGDLALTAALNGDVDGTIDALERFHSYSPPRSAYAKYYETFAVLAQLDTPRREALTTAKNWLENKLA